MTSFHCTTKKSWKQTKFVWFVFMLGSVFTGNTHSISVMADDESPPLAGGWKPAKLDDPTIVEAAEFCVQTLQEDDSSTSPDHSYSFQVATAAPGQTKILRASQQVVAGMNIKLTIMVTTKVGQERHEEDCVGAFMAQVYNHFGELTVTQWGSEMTCTHANAILEGQEHGDTN